MISITSSGSFKKTESFLSKMLSGDIFNGFDSFGQRGVDALANATPVNSGLTASSWVYRIVVKNGRRTIEWYNTNVNNGAHIAILIQYGHGTGTGGWVEGRNYINPAIQPVFDQIASDVWEKVTHG